jgi:hypothetical protein
MDLMKMSSLEFGIFHPSGRRNIFITRKDGEVRKPSKAQKKLFKTRRKIEHITTKIKRENELKEPWDE